MAAVHVPVTAGDKWLVASGWAAPCLVPVIFVLLAGGGVLKWAGPGRPEELIQQIVVLLALLGAVPAGLAGVIAALVTSSTAGLRVNAWFAVAVNVLVTAWVAFFAGLPASIEYEGVGLVYAWLVVGIGAGGVMWAAWTGLRLSASSPAAAV